MKLYTEEEIVNFLKKEFADEINAETFMQNLTPIELPSDEDIIKDSKYKSLAGIGWIEGAKWMRDKIQGGNR
jgi:transcriptional regulator of met regulon